MKVFVCLEWKITYKVDVILNRRKERVEREADILSNNISGALHLRLYFNFLYKRQISCNRQYGRLFNQKQADPAWEKCCL